MAAGHLIVSALLAGKFFQLIKNSFVFVSILMERAIPQVNYLLVHI